MKPPRRKPTSFFSIARVVLAAAGLAALGAAAQQSAPQNAEPAGAPQRELPALTMRVITRLVLVDVVVSDKEGRAITGLTRDDFVVLENGRPQTLTSFSLESPATRRLGAPEPPPLPPNVYTNRPEYRIPPGPLTILLLDALNTPTTDQAYARQKMLEYVDTQLLGNQSTAILALTSDLLVLQDFTSDPALLRAALDKHLPQSSTALVREERGLELNAEVMGGSDRTRPLPEQIVENAERFLTEQSAVALDSRVLTTLSALRAIARGVAGYPGRKNLIWVSAAFPFAVLPEETENFDLLRYYSGDLHRTATALTDAQIAVYPVDARGLVGSLGRELPSAAESGRHPKLDVLAPPIEAAEELDRRATALLFTQHTMRHIAEATGGRAFLNRNDIDRAVSLSIEDGSTYYTLGYYPEDTNWNGGFRRIRVKVNQPDLEVRHRRGYYAFNPVEAALEPGENVFSGAHNPKDRTEGLRAALSSPLPATTVTFRVGVPPPAPAAPGTPARVECRFLVDAHTILFEDSADGVKESDLDFLVVAFDSNGKGVASNYQTVETRVPLQNLPWLRENGLPFTVPLELGPGQYQLRLVVRDNRTGLMGTADAAVTVEEPKT